jgi:SAM-dependent methyltransferase
MLNTCIVCGSTQCQSFHVVEDVPVQCNVLWPDRDAAINAPTGSIALAFCSSCGHIWNTAFDPERISYDPRYENSLHFSSLFKQYVADLIDRLEAKYSLRGKHVIDVGCGRGDFLIGLCERTGCHGIGFDRAYASETRTDVKQSGSVRFVDDFYGESYSHLSVDLLTCRHVLEHIEKPTDFLRMIHQTSCDKENVSIFFEVPNARYTVNQLGIWDVIYEHVSYFTAESLHHSFRLAGFEVDELDEVYGSQFLTINARICDRSYWDSQPACEASVDLLANDISRFADLYSAKMAEWSDRIQAISSSGTRAVIWGSGSKGVTFLNAVSATNAIPYAVDINPRKHGQFVAGTGQKVIPPSLLAEYMPEIVIVMNPLYEPEIRQQLGDMHLEAQIIVA